MIPKDQQAEIERLFFVEGWKKGTIARELGVHHSVVTRVIREAREGKSEPKTQPSILEPYVDFIMEVLGNYPKIAASRLHRMVQERGYPGGPDHFRHELRRFRPRRKREAFVRLKTLPGEEAQVDWAHFGRVRIGKASRQLMAFVMVLSYSRRIFVHFFLGQSTVNFLRGHVLSFKAMDGVPRRILYDNLKSAVLERRRDAIRFHPDLLALSTHYRFEPRPVAPYRGNEKGRVERAIRYLRTSFFEALAWDTIDELNERVRDFCETVAMERPWPDDRTRKVKDVVEEERPMLLPHPRTPFPAHDRVEVTVRKSPYVRFDTNDYSVPHKLVGETVTVVATMATVRVLFGTEVVASHKRSFDRDQVIEDPAHIEELLKMKRRARRGRGLDRLQRTVPKSDFLLRAMAARGRNIGSATFALLKLLDTYGRKDLAFGIDEALRKGAFHPHAVRHAIERRREQAGEKPVLPTPLPDDPRIKDLTVTPHDLKRYDEDDDHDVEEQVAQGEGEEDQA